MNFIFLSHIAAEQFTFQPLILKYLQKSITYIIRVNYNFSMKSKFSYKFKRLSLISAQKKKHIVIKKRSDGRTNILKYRVALLPKEYQVLELNQIRNLPSSLSHFILSPYQQAKTWKSPKIYKILLLFYTFIYLI